MTNTGEGAPRTGANVMRVLEMAFPDDHAPGQLSVAVVSLVELCSLAMPDPARVREALNSAGFIRGADDAADDAARMLALDNKVVATPVTNMKHELYGKERNRIPVAILLSEGETEGRKIVFCSALFREAVEADAIKAAVHVTKAEPLTGSKVRNHHGNQVRRVMWDLPDTQGIRGFMVSGPQSVEATNVPRAFTGFNWLLP